MIEIARSLRHGALSALLLGAHAAAPPAASAAPAELDLNRVAWTELRFKASKLMFRATTEIQLERATLLYEFLVINDKPQQQTPLTILDGRGKALRPSLGEGDPMQAFQAELKAVLTAVRTGRTSPILDGRLARDAVILCHKQTQSVRTGKPARI